ncbi:hypothetical protein C8Q79DRAFT_935626 [Trametes meyenii]|nr:hypothetical protein C8Q79DRAFT_935626 [Trametes meyenii]
MAIILLLMLPAPTLSRTWKPTSLVLRLDSPGGSLPTPHQALSSDSEVPLLVPPILLTRSRVFCRREPRPNPAELRRCGHS